MCSRTRTERKNTSKKTKRNPHTVQEKDGIVLLFTGTRVGECTRTTIRLSHGIVTMQYGNYGDDTTCQTGRILVEWRLGRAPRTPGLACILSNVVKP